VSALLPDGVQHLGDLPYTLHDAIVAALGFLAFEELPSDERPERNIWMDPKALAQHWRKVKRARDDKYNPDKTVDEVEGGEVSRNSAVDDLIL
jgi:hypothetical protein